MNTNNWKYFNLSSLFDIKKAYAYNTNSLPEIDDNNIDDTIFCVTRTAQNNGCDYKAQRTNELKIEKGNALTIGGEGIICFYQKYEFVCGTNMTILRHNKLNEHNGLFVATVINFYSKDRFSYNRAFNKTQIEKTMIKLPVQNSNSNEPDWDFMQNYIISVYNDIISLWNNNLKNTIKYINNNNNNNKQF